MNEFKGDIQEAVEKGLIEDNQISEHEEILVSSDESDEEKELDFNKRFSLSKDERRRFWMVKVRDPSKQSS